MAVGCEGHLVGVRTHLRALLSLVLPRCSQLCLSTGPWHSLEVRRGVHGTCRQQRDRREGHEAGTLIAGVPPPPSALAPASAEIPRVQGLCPERAAAARLHQQ